MALVDEREFDCVWYDIEFKRKGVYDWSRYYDYRSFETLEEARDHMQQLEDFFSKSGKKDERVFRVVQITQKKTRKICYSK